MTHEEFDELIYELRVASIPHRLDGTVLRVREVDTEAVEDIFDTIDGTTGSAAEAPARGEAVQRSDGTEYRGRLSVGGWAVAIFFFGFVGGLVGYVVLCPTDPDRARHVLKWGAIVTAVSVALYVIVIVGLVLALHSATHASSGP